MAPQHTRDKILDAAESLFFADGIAVTGVDRVAQVAGVSVVTLYNHMGNKDGLLTAVLQRRLDDWARVWQECIDATADERGKVLAIFDAVDVFRQRAGDTQWCTFLATASERPPAQDSPGALVTADTRLLTQRLTPLAQAAAPDDVSTVVETTVLLYNGVLASILRGEPRQAAAVGRRAACRALGWDDLIEPGAPIAKSQRSSVTA